VTVTRPGKYDIRARKGYQNDSTINLEGSR
jgi:hypothetical protein